MSKLMSKSVNTSLISKESRIVLSSTSFPGFKTNSPDTSISIYFQERWLKRKYLSWGISKDDSPTVSRPIMLKSLILTLVDISSFSPNSNESPLVWIDFRYEDNISFKYFMFLRGLLLSSFSTYCYSSNSPKLSIYGITLNLSIKSFSIAVLSDYLCS